MKPMIVAAVSALALVACNKGATPAASPEAQAAGVGLDPNTVVATYGEGKKVTLGELDQKIAKDIFELRRKHLEAMVLENLLNQEASKVGKTEEQFLKDLEEKLAPPITDEEVAQIYEANKERAGGRSLEEVKPMIVGQLRQQKAQDAIVGYLEKLKSDAKVKLMLPEPRVNVAATGPSKGPAGAQVTIVEFSDFQCPYCSRAAKTAEQVLTAFAGKVRLVFRDYPLPFHDKAKKAAEAGHCADEQGKFWEMHNWMFDHQDKLDVAGLKDGAKSLGIDPTKFDPCLDSGKYAKAVDDSMNEGQKAGVSGTPAFFINGKLLSGAQPFEAFKASIEAELNK